MCTESHTHTDGQTYIYCLFSWHSRGLALRARLGVRLMLEAGSCYPVSSSCVIRLKARSLAQRVCAERWQLGSITHLVTRHPRSVERAWLAHWLTIYYLQLNCYHFIWKNYCENQKTQSVSPTKYLFIYLYIMSYITSVWYLQQKSAILLWYAAVHGIEVSWFIKRKFIYGLSVEMG